MARSKVTDVPMALAVKIELFKRGCFDFITVKDGLKHEKQEHALKILTDNEHVELLYGGAAGDSAHKSKTAHQEQSGVETNLYQTADAVYQRYRRYSRRKRHSHKN